MYELCRLSMSMKIAMMKIVLHSIAVDLFTDYVCKAHFENHRDIFCQIPFKDILSEPIPRKRIHIVGHRYASSVDEDDVVSPNRVHRSRRDSQSRNTDEHPDKLCKRSSGCNASPPCVRCHP